MEQYKVRKLCRKFWGLKSIISWVLGELKLDRWPSEEGHISIERIDQEMLTCRFELTDNDPDGVQWKNSLHFVYPCGVSRRVRIRDGQTILDRVSFFDRIFLRGCVTVECKLVNKACELLYITILKGPKGKSFNELVREILERVISEAEPKEEPAN